MSRFDILPLFLGSLAIGSLALAGCAHPPQPKPEPVAETKPAPASPVVQATPTRSCSVDGDCGDRQLCVSGQCAEITPDLAECSESRVHFAFNVSEIDTQDRASLERMARCLRADRVLHVTIEGNADERGTEDYNLHLGDRRATAVEHYLANLGVSTSQLKTVSYGKDQPLCSEHSEDCWAQNRRAAVKPKVVAESGR